MARINFIKDDGTPKGAWVVLSITYWTLVIFTAGVFSEYVANNLVKVGMFILGFYGMTLGAYTGKKGFEKYMTGRGNAEIHNNGGSGADPRIDGDNIPSGPNDPEVGE